MAASTAALANAALAHLGVAGAITTLSSDTTTAGKACREFYPRARQETLIAHPWQCAKVSAAALTLVTTIATTDEQEWEFRYRLPENCLAPRRIVWGVRNPTADQEVPFTLEADTGSTTYDAAVTYTINAYAQSASLWYRALRTTIADTPALSASDWVAVTAPPKFLLTDQQGALLEYTMDLTDPTRFDPDLESAIVAKLAYYIAPAVTVNGSAPQLRNDVAAIWDHLLASARANDYRAKQRDTTVMSGYRLARTIGRR